MIQCGPGRRAISRRNDSSIVLPLLFLLVLLLLPLVHVGTRCENLRALAHLCVWAQEHSTASRGRRRSTTNTNLCISITPETCIKSTFPLLIPDVALLCNLHLKLFARYWNNQREIFARDLRVAWVLDSHQWEHQKKKHTALSFQMIEFWIVLFVVPVCSYKCHGWRGCEPCEPCEQWKIDGVKCSNRNMHTFWLSDAFVPSPERI